MLRTRKQSRRAHPRRAVAVAMALSALLGACTAKGGSPGPTTEPGTPDQVAAALAAGLAKRDVSAVPFVGATGAETNDRLAAVVSGMGSLEPTVTLGPVTSQGDQATATLHSSWSFPGVPGRWSYDSTAQLVEDGGDWKATWQPSIVHPGLDGTNRLSERRDAAARGEVLGAGGEAIVTERPVVRIGIDKTKVGPGKAAASATRLAKLVDIDARAYATSVKNAGPAAYVEAIVLRQDARNRPTNRSIYAIPGAVPMSGTAMLAPSRDFARQVLGTVGQAS